MGYHNLLTIYRKGIHAVDVRHHYLFQEEKHPGRVEGGTMAEARTPGVMHVVHDLLTLGFGYVTGLRERATEGMTDGLA